MRWFVPLAVMTFIVVLSGRHANAQPSGMEILKHIEAGFSGIDDYTVALNAKVDLDRLKVPEMKATMYFKRPDKTHFESEGFALLPKEGVAFTPGNLSARFVVDSVHEQQGRYVLTMRPRSDKTKLRKVFLTTNPDTWTVDQIVTPQFDGRQMSATFEYRKVDNHWMPSQLTVVFTSETSETEPADVFGQAPAAQRPSQIPRKGTITILYSNFRINTGLSDDIFNTK